MNKFLKKIFFVFIIFIALVAASEILYRLLKIPKITHQDVYAKAQALVPKINSNSILIIGDSRLEWGMKPILVLEKFKAMDSNCNVIDMAMPGSNGLDMLHYLVQHNIYPKLIIHGYGVDYGNYNNHDFDKQKYSNFNKISESFSYWLDEHLYFRDKSVLQYIRHIPLYFKGHQYDSLGGATVTEYGDYYKRLAGQYEMYKSFKNNFKQTALDKYCTEANAAIETLKNKGTVVYAVSMPISKKIYDLENLTGSDVPANISYNKFYNFSAFTYNNETPAHDSTYFYDGCHLLPEYAKDFTEKVVDSLRKDFALFK